MVSVDISNESCTRGCLRTNRLYCVSISLVLLIAVAILFLNLFNEEFRWNESSVYSSSPHNKDLIGSSVLGSSILGSSVLGGLRSSTDEELKSKIHTYNKIIDDHVLDYKH